MHFLVAVIHNEDEYASDIIERFNSENEDYIEFNTVGTIEDIPKEIAFRIERYKELNQLDLAKELENALTTKPFNELVDWYLEYDGFIRRSDQYGYEANLDARYDWCEEGGRWNNFLVLNDGTSCNYAKCSDVSIEKTIEKRRKVFGERYDKDIEMGFKPRITREQAVDGATFSFYSYVLDGEWYDNNNLSDDTLSVEEWRKVCENLILENPDKYITIIDCHN